MTAEELIGYHLSDHTRNESTRNKITTRRMPQSETKMQRSMVYSLLEICHAVDVLC